MLLKRWNYEKQKYEPFRVLDSWNVPLLSNDMEETINCASCGKELPYGKCYTSREIHNEFGLGFGVCDKCYKAEWERKQKYERNKSKL